MHLGQRRLQRKQIEFKRNVSRYITVDRYVFERRAHCRRKSPRRDRGFVHGNNPAVILLRSNERGICHLQYAFEFFYFSANVHRIADLKRTRGKRLIEPRTPHGCSVVDHRTRNDAQPLAYIRAFRFRAHLCGKRDLVAFANDARIDYGIFVYIFVRKTQQQIGRGKNTHLVKRFYALCSDSFYLLQLHYTEAIIRAKL